LNPQPLDYAAKPRSKRLWRKRDTKALLCGALFGGLLVGIYFGEGNGILFFSNNWWDLAFVPGYRFGLFIYENLIASENVAIAAGIVATVALYGLFAVILVRGFVALRYYSRRW
jgi:hypothetical protein